MSEEHFQTIIKNLLDDPDASVSKKIYAVEVLSDYLVELQRKDGSVLNGLISAIEIYLDK